MGHFYEPKTQKMTIFVENSTRLWDQRDQIDLNLI